MANVTYTANSAGIAALLNKDVVRYARQKATRIANCAEENVHVITGTLADSIVVDAPRIGSKKVEFFVLALTSYAIYEEARHPFLSPCVIEALG